MECASLLALCEGEMRQRAAAVQNLAELTTVKIAHTHGRRIQTVQNGSSHEDFGIGRNDNEVVADGLAAVRESVYSERPARAHHLPGDGFHRRIAGGNVGEIKVLSFMNTAASARCESKEKTTNRFNGLSQRE
jgi:hypothetical protein